MPQVRKLAPEEVQQIQNKGKGQRQLVGEQYDALLRDFQVGEYGEATLEAEDNRLTVRNRLKAAAKRRNVGLEFKRATGDIVRFQIVEGTSTSAPGATDDAPAVNSADLHPVVKPAGSKSRGRPKKQVA